MAESTDRYGSFAELKAQEVEDEDFAIDFIRRPWSRMAILAPHGGCIEPGTTILAREIAATDFSFYAFEGLKRRPHSQLHVTSSRFDEPECVGLVEESDHVLTVHGLAGSSAHVLVGGRANSFRDAIARGLSDAGFSSSVASSGGYSATSPENICNRGRLGEGVQLEITRGLRDTLCANADIRSRFVDNIRQTILRQMGL